MYHVSHNAYCGMQTLSRYVDDESEARQIVADRLSRLRRKYPVQTLTKGKTWEILEPADCVMVPDACGVISLEHITYACEECGSEHEESGGAFWCCKIDEDADNEE
jgi:hypothetical protein